MKSNDCLDELTLKLCDFQPDDAVIYYISMLHLSWEAKNSFQYRKDPVTK